MTAIELIARERAQQIETNGYSSEHDDGFFCGELACAAACYAAPSTQSSDIDLDERLWPRGWSKGDFGRERELVIAGALIVAEIERLRRAKKASK